MSRYPSGFSFEELLSPEQLKEIGKATVREAQKGGLRSAATKRLREIIARQAESPSINPYETPSFTPEGMTQVEHLGPLPHGPTEVDLGHQYWSQAQAVGAEAGAPKGFDPRISGTYAQQPLEDTEVYRKARITAARIKLAKAAEGLPAGTRVLHPAGELNLAESMGAADEAGLAKSLLGEAGVGEEAAAAVAGGGKLASLLGKVPGVGKYLAGGLEGAGKFVPGIGWVITGLTVADALKNELIDKPRMQLANSITESFSDEDKMRMELATSLDELKAAQFGKRVDAAIYEEGANAVRGAQRQNEMARLLADNQANLGRAAVLSRPSLAELYAEMGV